MCAYALHMCMDVQRHRVSWNWKKVEQVISEKGKTSDKCKRRAHIFILLGLVKISM